MKTKDYVYIGIAAILAYYLYQTYATPSGSVTAASPSYAAGL